MRGITNGCRVMYDKPSRVWPETVPEPMRALNVGRISSWERAGGQAEARLDKQSHRIPGPARTSQTEPSALENVFCDQFT